MPASVARHRTAERGMMSKSQPEEYQSVGSGRREPVCGEVLGYTTRRAWGSEVRGGLAREAPVFAPRQRDVVWS